MKGIGSPVGDITERTPQQLMTMQDFAIGIIKAKVDEALRLERCELTSYVSQYFPEYSEQPELFFKEKPLQAYDFHMSLQVAHHDMKDILRQLDPQIKAWAILEAMYQHQNRQWENQLHVAREAHNRALDLSAQNIATLELVLKERKQEYEDRINEWKERKQEYEERINEWKQRKQEYEDRIKEWKEHKVGWDDQRKILVADSLRIRGLLTSRGIFERYIQLVSHENGLRNTPVTNTCREFDTLFPINDGKFRLFDSNAIVYDDSNTHLPQAPNHFLRYSPMHCKSTQRDNLLPSTPLLCTRH